MDTQPVPARADIHKSCKAIEVVVNLLNDYSEASAAVVGIQKKLAKAAREASSVRNTAEIAANALNSFATVLEAITEVDVKFAKATDKECESISNDVKKWFKQLAKEERNHDHRLLTANEKIKQAGQLYEKRVKKNPEDATEEHARYLNALAILGPEITNEKHQHAIAVTQQHTAVVYNLAVCLSRVADADWLRACEEVRRVSVRIGEVGRWRSLCEGSWLGAIPSDLPQPLLTSSLQSDPNDTAKVIPRRNRPLDVLQTIEGSSSTDHASNTADSNRLVIQSSNGRVIEDSSTDGTQDKLAEVDESRDRSQSVNSITSLGSFPTPPTHFPIPPVSSSSHTQTGSPDQTASQPLHGGDPQHPTETPTSSGDVNGATFLDFNSPPNSPATILNGNSDSLSQTLTDISSDKMESSRPTSGRWSFSPVGSSSNYPFGKGDYFDDGEFGVRNAVLSDATVSKSLSKPEGGRPGADTSSGSETSAIRDRYTRGTGPSSPPPRDIPRLPLSVSNLANRYENSQVSDIRSYQRSPADDQPRLSVESSRRDTSPVARKSSISSPKSTSSYGTAASDVKADDLWRNRHRIVEMEARKIQAQEYALRYKEQELEERVRELERDPKRSGSPHATTLFEPPSESPLLNGRHPYASDNALHLVPPAERYASQQHSSSQPPSPSARPPAHHSTSCGCERCSASKYGTEVTSRKSHTAEPQTSVKPEKPKGWIRRLSMPVMSNAFSNESKKNSPGIEISKTAMFRTGLVTPEDSGRLGLSMSHNRSNTSLIRR